MSDIIHGKNLIVTDGSGAVVACARSCEISKQTEMIETCSTANGTYKEYYPGRSSWSVSVSFFVTAEGVVLYSNTAVTLSLNGTLLGSAYIRECKITGTCGNLSQGTLVFQGTGPMGGSSGGSS